MGEGGEGKSESGRVGEEEEDAPLSTDSVEHISASLDSISQALEEEMDEIIAATLEQ